MVTVDDIRAGIDGCLGDLLLVVAGTVVTFLTPVEGADDDLSAIVAQRCDILRHIAGADVEGAGVQADFQTAFGGVHGGAVLFHIGDAGILQNLGGGLVAGLTEVFRVVVCQSDRFHGRAGHDLGVGGGTTEGEALVGAAGGRVGQGTFQIDDGKIIIFEEMTNIIEGIVVILADGLDEVVGIAPVACDAAESAVTGEGQGVVLFLGLGHGRFGLGGQRGSESLRGQHGFSGRSLHRGQCFHSFGHHSFRCLQGNLFLFAVHDHQQADLGCQQQDKDDQNRYFCFHRAPRSLFWVSFYLFSSIARFFISSRIRMA